MWHANVRMPCTVCCSLRSVSLDSDACCCIVNESRKGYGKTLRQHYRSPVTGPSVREASLGNYPLKSSHWRSSNPPLHPITRAISLCIQHGQISRQSSAKVQRFGINGALLGTTSAASPHSVPTRIFGPQALSPRNTQAFFCEVN